MFDLKVLEDGIPDAAYKPLAGDEKETARHFLRRNRDEREGQGRMEMRGEVDVRAPTARPLGARLAEWGALPEDMVEQIEAKARRFRDIRSGDDWHKLELACHLYVAAFLTPKTGGVPDSPGAAMVPTTGDVWEAPPWERIKLQEREFFAPRDPENCQCIPTRRHATG